MTSPTHTAPTLDDIETLARQAFDSLPESFRTLTGDIVFVVEDFPSPEIVADLHLESEFDILGLFSGAPLAAQEGMTISTQPTMIFLYRRPILDYWAEHGEQLGDIVRHVLIHEIGHHFGLSDEAMEEIEARA